MEACVLINKYVITSLPDTRLEQEPQEKASKSSKGENYNCNREGTEDFQRTSTLLFTLVFCKEDLITTCHMFELGSQTTHCFQTTPEMLRSARELLGCNDGRRV